MSAMENEVKSDITIKFKNRRNGRKIVRQICLPKYRFERQSEYYSIRDGIKSVTVCFKPDLHVCAKCEKGKKKEYLMSSKGVDVHVQVLLIRESLGVIRQFPIFFENIPGCLSIDIPHNVKSMSVTYWCDIKAEYADKYAGY